MTSAAINRVVTATAIMTVALSLAQGREAAAQEGSLNIYNWSDYIGETTLEDFTRETGIQVNYDVYDSNEVLEARLLAGNSGYDLVMPTASPFAERHIQAGIYQPLDKSKIPNLANLDEGLMERVAKAADPGNEHTAIYQWGTNGFGYNTEMIEARMADAPVNSWDMVFDPAVVSNFADCGVAMLDSPSEMFPKALHYLGHDPANPTPETIAEAEALLLSIRPHIKYFHSSQYINDLANGDICLAVGFSGDIIQAQFRAEEVESGVDIRYVIPEEGSIVWFDVMAIPADAPNPEAAHAFIDFVLRPENMAGITNYVAYANAVPASAEFVDPEIRNDTQIYPTSAVQARLFSVGSIDQRIERLRTRAWTRIRTGQ